MNPTPRAFELPPTFLRTGLRAWLLLAAWALASTAAWAQGASGWPSKQPIRLVVVFPPGGSVDQVARVLAPALQQQLGQNILIENKGGASGSIGTGQVAAAPPDGYTFAVVFDTHAVNPALLPNLPFDTRRDLTAVALLGTGAMLLSAHAEAPFKTMADVVAAAKARASEGNGGIIGSPSSSAPKGASYGSIGSGSLGHLAMTLLARTHQLDLVHVPYRGGGPLVNDVLAGHVPLAISSIFLAKPHLDTKRLRALAVTTSRRSPLLPEVPTFAESGFAGFDAPAWWAVLAPAKTPPDIVARMNAALNAALAMPEVAGKLAEQGIDLHRGTPAAAQQFIERQIDAWARVVRDNGIKAD